MGVHYFTVFGSILFASVGSNTRSNNTFSDFEKASPLNYKATVFLSQSAVEQKKTGNSNPGSKKSFFGISTTGCFIKINPLTPRVKP